MSQKYYSILTQVGANKLADATANETTIKLTHIAVGDGSGSDTNPNASDTELVNEVYRTEINELKIDENNSNYVVVSSMIPPVEGNFWVREIGLFDEDGDLIAIGNKSATFKPILADGEANELLLRIAIEVTNSDAVELVIDPSVVMASQEYVNEGLEKKSDKNHTHDYATPQDLADLENRMGLPVGFSYLANKSEPDANELIELGGEFNRVDFPELWIWIEKQTSLLKTEEEWQLENTTNGMCGFFSIGDGTTTFRLRNMNESMLIAVNNVDNDVGGFREGEIKSHSHIYNRPNISSHNSTSSAAKYYASSATATATGTTGGNKNTVDRIGALPIIVAKRG